MSALIPISPAELKAWLEKLPYPTELERHPLTRELYGTELVQRFLNQHPPPQGTTAGRTVILALRDFWRVAFMQRNFSPKLKRIWNTFFILEANYFYPAAQTSLFPGSLNELGALLCDKEYLALLASDGHKEQAKKIAAENSAFWKAIIPDKEVPSPQTVSSRREAAIEKLAKELNRRLAPGDEPKPDIPVVGQSHNIGTTAPEPEAEPGLPTSANDSAHRDPVNESPALQLPEPDPLFDHSNLLLHYQERHGARPQDGLLPIRILAWPRGDEIGPSDLDAILASLDIQELRAVLGLRLRAEDQDGWQADGEFLTALLERFAAYGEDDLRLQCAACLRHIRLSKIVEIEFNLHPRLWGIRPLSALESLARLALDPHRDDFTRSLAEAILTQREHVECLWNRGKQYLPLAFKLTTALGARVYYDERLGRLGLLG